MTKPVHHRSWSQLRARAERSESRAQSHKSRGCFRCGSQNHKITQCLEPDQAGANDDYAEDDGEYNTEDEC